jgi:hypothetical protein
MDYRVLEKLFYEADRNPYLLSSKGKEMLLPREKLYHSLSGPLVTCRHKLSFAFIANKENEKQP